MPLPSSHGVEKHRITVHETLAQCHDYCQRPPNLGEAAGAEVEAGDGAGGASGSASQSGVSEAEMILGLVTGTNDQAANNLRQANQRRIAQPQAKSWRGGEDPTMPPSGKNPFEESANQLLQTVKRNQNSSEFHSLRRLTVNIVNRLDAYRSFAGLVANLRPWDIKRQFPLWSLDTIGATEYNRNVWGNIHYGYIGSAVGFLKEELLVGAGFAQYRSHINNTLSRWNQAGLVVHEVLAALNFGVSSHDDPLDTQAINLGIELWTRHGDALQVDSLTSVVRSQKNQLNTKIKIRNIYHA